VRGRGLAVEQAGRREQHGAVADGAEPLHAPRLSREPGEHGAIFCGGFPADSACDQERVRAADVDITALGDELEPARHRERPGARRDELRDIGRQPRAAVLGQPARRARKDLERPRYVEHLRLREAEHHDPVGPAGRPRASLELHGRHHSGPARPRRQYGRK
jgi:hypothetical protein